MTTYLSGAGADDERFPFTEPARSIERLEEVLVASLRARDDAAAQLRRQDAELAGTQTRLADTQVQFNALFTGGFCLRLRDDVRLAQSTLEKLNRELKNIAFGRDTYQLQWDWVPEFQKVFEFFEAVNDLADTLERDRVSVFDSQHLSEAHRATAGGIRRLLLSADEAASQQSLLELADPRNYRRYDIVRRNDSGSIRLSTWGTGAAGELQMPLYVLRSAVLGQALGHFGRDRKSAPALRLMLSDQALAGMDETHARSLLRFLSQQMGLQLVVAMPAAESGALKPEFAKEFSFSKVQVVRNGRMLSLNEGQEKALKQESMGRLWAAHAQAAHGQGRDVPVLPHRRAVDVGEGPAPVEDDA